MQVYGVAQVKLPFQFLPPHCAYCDCVTGAGSARILSDARSATIMMYEVGFVVMWPGKIPASTTNRLSVPQTLVSVSTTAEPPVRPSSVPSLFVPATCQRLFTPTPIISASDTYRSSDWNDGWCTRRASSKMLAIRCQKFMRSDIVTYLHC